MLPRMPRSVLSPLSASLRALRSVVRAPSVAWADRQSLNASLFDSSGATGMVIEVAETAQGALALHAHLTSSPEVESLLIVDPAGVWAPGVMDALSDATGSPIDRLRVHSRGGLLVRAVVDETLLPAGSGPHRLVRCLHGSARETDRRTIFSALLSHSRVCAVLIGPMPALEAQGLIEEVHRLSQSAGAAHVRWLFYIGADHRGLEARIEGHHWPVAPVVLQARPLARSLTAVWNSLYEAWVTLKQ